METPINVLAKTKAMSMLPQRRANLCGIYAIIPRGKVGLYSHDIVLAKQMMLDTVQRGEHSSGIFATHYKFPHQMPTGVKVIGGPHNIYGNKPLWTELSDWMGLNGGCIIGHGRLATKGKISAKNAHPFQHEHITLVHNGTLTSGISFEKKGETDIEVDSHALAVSMAEKGMMEALSDIKGAYAIIAHDAKEGCLWIARNHERPLYVYSNKDRHFIMSEDDYLLALVNRNFLQKDKESILEFLPETLVKIDLFNPQDYRLFGDIKELRRNKEKAQQESNIPKYQGKVKSQYQHPANDYTKENPTKEIRLLSKTKKTINTPKVVAFKVTSVRNYKANFLYEAEMIGDNLVHFQTHTIHEGYIGRTGSAPVHTVHENGLHTNYFVKHRSIEWFDNEDKTILEAEKEEGAPLTGGNFLTYNGKCIGTAAWRERIEGKEGCFMCDADFRLLDYKTTVLTDDDKLLCKKCANELHVYDPAAPTLIPQPNQTEILH